MAQDVIEALSESEKKKDLKVSREIGKSGKIAMIYLIMWLRRVLSSSLDSLIKLRMQRERTLAALFIKRPDKVDQVLKKIEYDDDDLDGFDNIIDLNWQNLMRISSK